VFSIEDSYDSLKTKVEQARIQLASTKWGYIVALINGTSSKLYEIHVTRRGRLISKHNYAKHHINMQFRNISDDPR
jgi:hypothetical protein